MFINRQVDIEPIEALLQAHCRQVELLRRRQLSEAWRQWHLSFPLQKPPHSIVLTNIFDRIGWLRFSLTKQAALSAYRSCEVAEFFVLTLDALSGWKCVCESATPPPVETLEPRLFVFPSDYAWTFGVGCGTLVFIQPEKGDLNQDGYLESLF